MAVTPGVPRRRLPPDAELVNLLRHGDEGAFALVVDAWSDGMLRLARDFVSTRDSAVEVVQETWLAVVQGIDRFEGRSSLKTWVYRILVNTAKRRGRRESRSVPWSSLPAAEDQGPTVDPARFRGAGDPYEGHWREFPAPWPSPEQEALAGEVRAQVAAALARLPSRQRIVITLRDVEGYDAEEVCSILEISAANQRVLLHRARAAVRAALEEYFTGRESSPADEEAAASLWISTVTSSSNWSPNTSKARWTPAPWTVSSVISPPATAASGIWIRSGVRSRRWRASGRRLSRPMHVPH